MCSIINYGKTCKQLIIMQFFNDHNSLHKILK